MKKYFFISGLPRSGNTLLSSLLNQNPDITVSGQSIIPEIFFRVEEIRNTSWFENFPYEKGLENVSKNIFNNYFKNHKTKYIIDRGPWTSEYNYNILKKYLDYDFKIIVLVRDINEILSSFIKLSQENEDFFLNKRYNQKSKTEIWRDELEEKCNILMEKDGFIDSALCGIKHLINFAEGKHYQFFEYNQLINYPKEFMRDLYNFLQIPKYDKHTFKELNQFSLGSLMYNDMVFGGPLHTIKTKKIFKNKTKNILPSKLIKKYSDMEFWRTR
mgnify:FL=1